MVVSIGGALLVLVEADHLVEHLLGDLVDRRQLEGRDSNLDIAQTTDDWLHFRIINSIQRLNNHEIILLLSIFQNCRFDRGEMLLVRQVDMVEKRAFARQEGAS